MIDTMAAAAIPTTIKIIWTMADCMMGFS